jgi:DNA primase
MLLPLLRAILLHRTWILEGFLFFPPVVYFTLFISSTGVKFLLKTVKIFEQEGVKKSRRKHTRGKQQSESYYSNLWKNRIVYIIRDKNGQIIGLNGRYAVDSEQEGEKYLESDEFLKTNAKYREKIWFKTINTQEISVSENLFLLYKYVKNPQQYRYVVLTEGEKDALRVWSQHIPNVAAVATFGCHLSKKQVELLKECFGEKVRVILAYDNDETGFNANIEAWKKLKESGFTNLVFAVYPQKWKDFGEMFCNNEKGTYKYVSQTLWKAYSLTMYVEEMQKRGFRLGEKAQEIFNDYQKEKKEKIVSLDFSQQNTKLEERNNSSEPQKEKSNPKENSVLNITFEIQKKVNKSQFEIWKQNFILEYDDYPDLQPIMEIVKEKIFGKSKIKAVK